jgi:hypothetical protein
MKNDFEFIGFNMQEQILCVDKDDNIFIRGYCHSKEMDKETECVISISKQEYFGLLNQFLEDKKRLFLLHNHFCGVDAGYIEKWQVIGETTILNNDYPVTEENVDTWKPVYKNVPIIKYISGMIEMEHG